MGTDSNSVSVPFFRCPADHNSNALHISTNTSETTSTPNPKNPPPAQPHEILNADKGDTLRTDRQKRRLEAGRIAKSDAKKQLSQSQLAANQANSQLSTGPSTPEGKAISSQNNFRHGLLANDLTNL